MGASQSLDAVFGSPHIPSSSEQADVYQYLRRVEKTLWVTGPFWSESDVESVESRTSSPTNLEATHRDPFKKMTPSEALCAISTMLDETWVSPLVALVDCVDPIARSAGLALLSRIVQRASVAKIFLAVKGMDKVMALLDSQDQQATHLALEVIFALCAGSSNVIRPLCEAGLIGRLTELIKRDNEELVLASLKALRLTLRQNAVKAELSTYKTLGVLMDLVHSPHPAIARTAVASIGLSLPNTENLVELLRLGCIDTFLRLMSPTNPNVDVVIFALSLIADETDTIFPREQTTAALGRMLETLRGAAKRSPAASATSFLFASLAKSSIFHSSICSETNLGILAKLLVGGSPEVLVSTAYALGIVALHANDRVRQTLFQVDAPQNLVQLVTLSGPGRDEKVARLAIFALATVTNEALVSRTGPLVRPELSSSSGALHPLRVSTIASCEGMQGNDVLTLVYARAIERLGIGSTYALKLLAALSTASHVKKYLCEAESVVRMLEYLRGASADFLPSLLVLFLECCSNGDDCSLSFCKLLETTPDALQILGALFQKHQPEHLFGLTPLLGALAGHSALINEHISSSTFFVDQALNVASRVDHEALHEQVLGFLEGLTAHKNTRALEQIFASDPDRIANLLQASLNTRAQLLGATLLRRLFKRLNSIDIPSTVTQRHLAKLLATSSVDIAVAVAACRVWGNLFQYEDKCVAFAQIPDSVSGLLQLLQRCIGNQPAFDPATIQVSSDLEAEEKKVVLSGLKPLYWVIRSVFRTACCETTKQALIVAPHFLCIMDLFPHFCDPIARLAIDTMSELARSKTPGLRRTLAVPVVLNAIQQLLLDRERASTGRGVLPQRHVLRFLGLLARRDATIQHLVVERRLLEALLLLLHSPSTALNSELLAETLDALAWVCSAARSPAHVEAQAEIDDEAEVETLQAEVPARRVVATSKMVDFTLRHVDSALAPVAHASLHLLQRLACEQPGVPRFVYDANGASVVMRALQQRPEYAVRRRACGLVRHLVHRHDGNRQHFEELGATSFLVELIKGLQALAALCEGSSPAARASKKELLECDQSAALVRIVSADDDERLCAAWTRALAMGTFASSNNQRRLVSAGLVPLLTKLLRHPSGFVRVPTAQLLAYLAEAQENRGVILNEGGEVLLSGIIASLQSELPGLQRYAALLVANLATRHEANKVRLGAAGAASPLVDRLSSQRRNVLENVLLAVVKLGSHAGNKVKLGGKVCFEKLLSLVHHEVLEVAKGAARALAVIVVGNDANKKFLLQCEAPVVAELSALLKGSNGSIVESTMLVLGELAPMPAQALELSRCIDVLAVVKLVSHINPRIARAALLVVRHLTRESFNKTRFGFRECVEALLARLRLGLSGASGADELEMVELTVTCLANLSFAPRNASRIAERGDSLLLLLQLTTSALPAAVKDYLSEREVSRLVSQNDEEMYQSMARDSFKKGVIKSDEPRRAELGSRAAMLDFIAFPSLQTAVLEQTLLLLSNCAEQYRTLEVVDTLSVAVLCQALQHSSELVARCGCYTLACWLKQNTTLQDAATKRGALQTLSKLLTSTSLVVVEAAAYVLSKLAARGDNPMKLVALDVPATLVHGILRKPANVPHDRVLDRAVRLLGTLVQFSRVRQGLKGEEIIADVLTPLLQLHTQTLGKNISRLVLALLADDSLKFFLPKKTVSLLRVCFVHQGTSAKTIRNVLRVFALLVTVEEHKTTITLEDSGEALGRIVQELRGNEGVLGENDETVLGLLACIAGTRKIAVLLHENDVYVRLPPYILTLQTRRLHSVQTAARLCKSLGDQAVRRLSELEFTSLLLDLLPLYFTASPTRLSQLVWECLDVLRQLCSLPYDEQVIVEEGGVEVIVAYFELWLSVTLGVAPDLLPSEGESLILALTVSLSAIIRTLSAQTPYRELLVHAGGFPLVLKALALGTPELPNPQREQLAEALAGLSSLPIMVPYLEASPDLVAPMFRFMVAPHTQQLTHLLLLSLRAFADVMEVSPASRSYVLEITGGTVQPLPFLLSCLQSSSISATDDSIVRLLHTMRSIQRLVMDEATARILASLDDLPSIGRLLSQVLPLPSYDDRLEIVQLMATETLGYLAFFGHAPQLRLERSAIARLLAQADYTKDESVKPENVATTIWTLTLLATPQVSSSNEPEKMETTASCVRSWIWEEPRGLDVLISCGLRAPDCLNLPRSVVSHVLSVLRTATEKEPEAETVLALLVHKQVCTPVAALLEAVEPNVRRPALQLLARILNKQVWASNEPDERWSAVLLHLAEWLHIYAQDPQSIPLSELRDAFSCLSVLTSHNEIAAQFQKGEAPRGLINLVATSLHHFGGKRLPSRPESLVLIRRESTYSEESSPEATDTAERTRLNWSLQFATVLHVLRVCRRLISFSTKLSEDALELHVPRALDSLVLLHDRQILDEALRCMLHLATLHGEETELLFSSDRTVARLKGLLQSESRPLQARITPILSLMAANMPTLPGLCSMDGVLILSDLAVSSSAGGILTTTGANTAPTFDRRVFEDSCTMLHMVFSQVEGIVLAFDVAQVVPKLFGIVETMTATGIASRDDTAEVPELLHLLLSVLVKVSAVPAVHVRFLELLPRICRLLDGESGPAKLTGRWCEMLLSILFNVFGCPFGSNFKTPVETLAQGKNALLPQLLPLKRWLSAVDFFPTLGRLIIELIRAFVGNGELSSPYATLFNSGEDIPALLKLVGSSSEEVAIPSAQLLLAVLKQRDVRVALIVADGIPALVAALCQASNIKVQNLLLTLVLDLSRGDTEVQALLLTDPHCVARLVGFVQESVDIHAANDNKEINQSLDERLKLTCTLLTELSRALYGPERIVEVSGHLPMLALSIQQQERDILGARRTVEILTNLAIAGLTVASGLAASKLPSHFLSCVLADDQEPSKLNETHALPGKRQLALTGLVALAKANRELRATLAQNKPLVVLLESLLQNSDQSTPITVSRDALQLVYLMSTAGCVGLVNHSSRDILSRICAIILQSLTLHKEGDDLQDEEFTPVEVARGLTLLANLLDVAHEQEAKVKWHPQKLLDLAALLEARVAAHQTPKRQLPALRVLRGAFSLTTADTSKKFYYPLTPKLLAELLTVLLVSASRQHREMAERIVVSAFQNDPERARESVGDNQILEQLLIVFTQPGTDASELAVVLTQVLYVSISRGFVVSQRFLAKLPALLALYCGSFESDDANQPLKIALSVYLSFVHSSCPPESAMRSGISDMLRSEGDSRRALTVLLHQLLLVHPSVCLSAHPSKVSLDPEDAMLWTCIVESVSPLTPALASTLLSQASTSTWMCFLRDWLHMVEKTEKPDEELLRNSCRMFNLCCQCLVVLSCGGDSLPPRVIEGALQAMLDVREAWGDALVLTGCSTFKGTAALLPKLLHVFQVPEREANLSRHLVLQLLLLLASTGHLIEEMKAAGTRSALENNPLIAPGDKALPVALLGMLGYSADLNEEFARALQQFDAARSEEERRERVAYLLRFLERYVLTHAPTKEQAIDSFTSYLVADAEKAQNVAMATEHEPEVTKDEFSSASKLASIIASDCVASLVKISGWSPPDRSISSTLSSFGELYLARWDLNALLAVAFARQRGDEDNDFQERPRLESTQIAHVLELAGLVRAQLEENARTGGSGVVVVGQIDARWLCNAFMLQVLELVHWLAVNSSTCFDDICRNAALLHVFFTPLMPVFCGDVNGEKAMELFLSLVEMTVNTPTPGAETTASIEELLLELLKFLYAQVEDGLLQNVRARLLLCVLVILQRTGDAGRAACVAYERAIQQILWHIHASSASELQARCSWELLSSLSELDPAITSLFNLDAIPVLLRECGCDLSKQETRPSSGSWRHSKRAVAFRQAEALKCLARAANTHDEVLLKIGEAPGIAATLPVDSAGVQAHAALLIARIAAQEDLRASLVSPENISLLIESLESVHLPVVLHALQALAHLCAFSLCLDALVRNATVPVLAQILFSPLVETPRRCEIEACVLALLGKMCDRSQIVSRRIVSSNLLPKLCELLVVEKQFEYTQREFGVHNNAVWIVYSLSKDAELVPKLVAHSILETLSDQLLEYEQSSSQRKALGAMSRLASVADMDSAFLQSLIRQIVESVRRNVPVPDAHRSVTNALAVFNAILKAGKNRHSQQRHRRPQSEGVRAALDLLGAVDPRIKLEAFRVVSEFVEDHPDLNEVRELLLGSEGHDGSHALLSLVRALSDEARSITTAGRGKNDLLLVVMTLLNMLLADEVLKMKLTPTTYDVVLQVVVAISATSSNLRVLSESLKALTTMTQAGQVADLCPDAALVSSIESLVKLLQGLSAAEGGSTTSMRLNALFLLVNFASSDQCRLRMARCGALEALLGIIQSPGGATQDDQLVQLALLGVALMTTGGVSDAAAVVELSRAVDTLVRLLSSKSPSMLLKNAIVARGGPTALQAMLNENMSSDIPALLKGATQPQRPASSTTRIREYAPKAIKALGFAPIMPQGPPQ
ncbi:uncharacterized protein PITG_02073 [Phytophthora infestans T30-4]|uniref:Vacuolar protein 8 n=1 Tax=Phytophthora infestans (strain T30-4) TaxID=403677 RepID=D0MVE5_PHYIT|nr:uncharacterized protein PITG_02073 [Phytophthora infestans T30-4]EEY63608.1 conserved hypothetical protein [Phytophthora infestans T30-4]|eukprot:XP_002907044.1 conserved hypothetical protein [Phytophthora infestans T30-4]